MSTCPLDAGVDLFPSSIDKVVEYLGWNEVWINTCLHILFQPGFYGRITDRSSTTKVTGGATVIPGVIDAGYTGEIKVRLQVIMPRPYDNFLESLHPAAVALKACVESQTAIAQIIPVQMFASMLVSVDPAEVIKKMDGGRGNKGFGSTNNL